MYLISTYMHQVLYLGFFFLYYGYQFESNIHKTYTLEQHILDATELESLSLGLGIFLSGFLLTPLL